MCDVKKLFFIKENIFLKVFIINLVFIIGYILFYKLMKKKITQVFSNIKVIKGICINTANVGIKSKTKDDVAIVSFKDLANVAIVLTKSKTYAPNIKWLKKIKNMGKQKYCLLILEMLMLILEKKGYENVLKIVNKLAKIFECNKENILISSTGVIGEQLPIKKIIKSIPLISSKKNKNSKIGYHLLKQLLQQIPFLKVLINKLHIGNNKYSIIGICKGSGMIAPNMATMLAFLFTDANFSFTIKKMLNLH